jgi:hypothetical protein
MTRQYGLALAILVIIIESNYADQENFRTIDSFWIYSKDDAHEYTC